METEQNTPVVAKKLCNIVRTMFYMLRKGISKSKIVVDLHLMLKKGKLALNNLMFNHQHHISALICRSNDGHRSYTSPIKEYEFSCSNSPANSYPHQANKRKLHHLAKSSKYNKDMTTMHAVQRVLEMLNHEAIEALSPLVLPGFGQSPMVRQLRVTDSPFSLKDEDCDSQVDKAAEDFIKKFYKDLRSQKTVAALESPCHGTWGR